MQYFPFLDEVQRSRFEALDGLYREWNSRINVISRKDIDNLYEHHVLHSLAIARAVSFPDSSTVLDAGTGGGFPGIPLAIMFPSVQFTLCDSIAKKIRVAEGVASSLGLDNVRCLNCRVEDLPGEYDWAVSRAVASLSDLYGWLKGRFSNSLICLKGGDVESEAAQCAARWSLPLRQFSFVPVDTWFEEEWFKGKNVVSLRNKFAI